MTTTPTISLKDAAYRTWRLENLADRAFRIYELLSESNFDENFKWAVMQRFASLGCSIDMLQGKNNEILLSWDQFIDEQQIPLPHIKTLCRSRES